MYQGWKSQATETGSRRAQEKDGEKKKIYIYIYVYISSPVYLTGYDKCDLI